MPRWILECCECNEQFTHSRIPNERIPPNNLNAFLDVLFDKPDFPTNGLSLVCPHCKKTSLYQRHQLVYRSE